MTVARRFGRSLAAALVALLLTYPAVCAGGEFEPLNRCTNVLGLALPGFAYRPGEEYRIFAIPLLASVLAFAIAWWASRTRATSRS